MRDIRNPSEQEMRLVRDAVCEEEKTQKIISKASKKAEKVENHISEKMLNAITERVSRYFFTYHTVCRVSGPPNF